MRNLPMRAAVVIAAFLLGGVSLASAQEDPFMLDTMGPEQGMSSIDFDSARMSFFYQADTNGDLALSPDEMGQAMSHGGSQLFSGRDMDGDGVITLDEYMESGNELFKSLDVDGDGVLGSGEM